MNRPLRNSRVLQLLQQAKAESDRRNWAAKYMYLRKAMEIDRDGFRVDLPAGRHWGVTHVPTGFRIHAPSNLVGHLPRMDNQSASGSFEVDPITAPGLSKISARAENPAPVFVLFELLRQLT